MKKKLIFSIIALVLVIAMLAYVIYGYYTKKTRKIENPIVTMEIADYGTVKMELFPEYAPETVKNFIKLINEGYYDGLTFHRIEENLIQGGDKQGDETGSPEYTIKGEFAINDYNQNKLKFERGTVGLARQDYTQYYYYTGDTSIIKEGYNSGCEQFFIMTEDDENFNGYYAAFGKVTEGIEIIDSLTTLETTKKTDSETGEETSTSTPVNPPIITKMTVDTFGIKYDEPEKLEPFDIQSWFSKYFSYGS